ncbi:MAG: hypothetical protein NC120_06725 [Ruminococcus sp.]|nr:hypothetical protein [Ruminococcus sp.]
MNLYDFYIPYSIHYPAQWLAFQHIQENFLGSGVKELELLTEGIRLTDKTGAVADFLYNRETTRIDMFERDEKYLKKEARKKRSVQLIQRDLLKSMK